MTRRKILVTGANGQLGMELRQIENLYPQFQFVFATREQLSIGDKAAVDLFFKQHAPDWCINCAAFTAVDKAESEKESAILINGHGPGFLAAAAHAAGSGFIHISTDYVFDGNATIPLRETDDVHPVNAYGESKLIGEELAIKNHSQAIIIRTSWVYSAFGKNFVKTMLKLMFERPSVSVVSDQYGSPTYAADLADAILQIILKDNQQGGIYHFSNDAAISWYEFAVAIKEISGAACTVNAIPTSAYPTPAKRPAYSVMNKEKFIRTFGIPLKPWKESLEKCIGLIRQQGA